MDIFHHFLTFYRQNYVQLFEKMIIRLNNNKKYLLVVALGEISWLLVPSINQDNLSKLIMVRMKSQDITKYFN